MVLKVHTFLARWLSWLERRPVTAEVVGSNPIRVVYPQGYILISEYGILAQLGEHLPYKQRVIGSSPFIGFREAMISKVRLTLKEWADSRVAKGDRL